MVGCDGARSSVRTSIGRELHGDSANHAWGVMDVLAVTDFPDIRCKCLIQSAHEGNILVIPREGGYLVRLYVELAKLDIGERVGSRNITVEELIAKAQRILHPYKFEAKEVPWWSVYEIGQRLTDKFDDVPEEEVATRLPSVFIAGDACHTHSPKAGQGMNVSMQDAFNLGWKLVSVLQKRCPPSLLHTYSAERRAIAKELIDFDREWAALLASTQRWRERPGQNAKLFRQARALYRRNRGALQSVDPDRPGQLSSISPKDSSSGSAFIPRRSSVLADAKPVHLGHAAKADGRFRIFAFAGSDDPTAAKLRHPAVVRFSRAESGTLPSENTRAKARISTRSSMSARCSSRLIGSSPSRRCRRCFCPRRDVTASTTMRRCFAPTSKAATTSLPCAALIGRPDAWSSCGRINTSRTSFRSMDTRSSLRISTASCCRHQKPAYAGPPRTQRLELDRNSFDEKGGSSRSARIALPLRVIADWIRLADDHCGADLLPVNIRVMAFKSSSRRRI